MIAVITAFLAALMIRDGITGDHTGLDMTARIVGGALLIILAIVVAVLCVAPAWVRDTFGRRA
ncbi:MAG TPA: hypothetical protein VIH21_00620 [Dehalococcoidia bacterium]